MHLNYHLLFALPLTVLFACRVQEGAGQTTTALGDPVVARINDLKCTQVDYLTDTHRIVLFGELIE
jgi:hypothetical protein